MSDTLKPGAPGYAERLATDPLFLANESLRECSAEVVRRTEHYETRIGDLESQYAALRTVAGRGRGMSEPLIVVVKDNNDYNDDPITVYIDGKMVAAKVLTWWSDDGNEGTVLENHWWGFEDGDGEYRLPDEWNAAEWQAFIDQDGYLLPSLPEQLDVPG